MSEKIKIKATLHDGDTYTVRGTSVVHALATFISNRLTKDEVDILQGILKVSEKFSKSLNTVPSNSAAEPTPSSNAVLAERIVELDRKLSQYMVAAKGQTNTIDNLLAEIDRLKAVNNDLQVELVGVNRSNMNLEKSVLITQGDCRALKESNEASSKQIFELLAEIKALETHKLDSGHVIENFRKKTHGMEDDLATYEKRHAAMQAKVLELQEENRVMDNLIAVKQKDLAHYTEVIADLKHICSGYSGKIDALEKQVALQSSHAASLENQLVDRVRALDIQSSNVASLNRKYSSVCQYLVNFRDAFNRYTGSVDGSEFQRNAVANLQKLLAMYPEIVETDSDKTTSAVEWQAPAERGTEGY